MNTTARCGLALLFAAPLVAAGSTARSEGMPAPGWNMYSNPANITQVIGFSTVQYPVGSTPVDPNMGPNNGARINANIAGFAQTRATMDTGSTGIVVGSNHFNPAGLTPVGTGSQNYSSSGVGYTGTYYNVAVDFYDAAGTTKVATSKVPVLYIGDQDPDLFYMGVGFDRTNADPGNPAPVAPSHNPLLNLTWVKTGSVDQVRKGYVIRNGELILGIPNGDTSPNDKFTFVKLAKNQAGTDWATTGMTVSVTPAGGGAGSGPTPGTILQDTGIGYMFLTPLPGSGMSTTQWAETGTQVDITFPGDFASYGFSAVHYKSPAHGKPGNCPSTLDPATTPCSVRPDTVSPGTYVNTGREFFAGFDYLYDAANGYVGYYWTGNTTGGSSTPGVALGGTVPLFDGFESSLRTFLMGPTVLQQTGTGTFSGEIFGTGGLTISGGRVNLTAANSYFGGTTVTGGGILAIDSDSRLGDASGGLMLAGGTLLATGSFTTPRALTMGLGGGIVDSNGFDLVFGAPVSGPGSLTKRGLGVLTLSGANSYTGGTIVDEGILRLAPGASLSPLGGLTVTGGLFDLNGNDVAVGLLQGSGGTIALGANTLTVNQSAYTVLGTLLTGTGGLSLEGPGTLDLRGVNTYTGPTTVSNSRLAVNGSITSDVTVGAAGSLGGIGTIFGSVSNAGALAPGNSIGTLTVAGDLAQAPGSTYQVELDNQGQADRVNVGGTAQLGGTVNFIAAPGSYAAQQTYTILNAAGGIAGAFAGAMGNYAFLFPSLSYDANNVYLTIARSFARGAQTPNQAAVGAVLDANATTANGSFGNAIATLTTLSPTAGTAALNALSGQNYSGFSSVGVAGAQLFMSNFAGQAGGSTGGVNRVALAEACDVACDSVTPALWGAWGGAAGGLGTIVGTTNAGTLTYNLGGFAAGLDRKLAPDFLLGVTVGYSGGTQWVQGFQGQGTTSTVQAGLYGSYARGPVYVDGLAAYAYSDNQMTRQIAIPGIAAVNAQGRTGVNQLFGQVEAGYRFDIGGRAGAFVTPFARLQAATATQAAFTETGAGSLGLSVAAQTTNSLRTVFGAQLGGAMDLGWREKLAMQLRLGWGHEFADTARPVTASFIGAPASPFTTFGASPQRDSVVLGLAAATAIAEATSAYLRYEGDVSSQNAGHALTAGVRLTW
jgi:outer membrane autotransporter protein